MNQPAETLPDLGIRLDRSAELADGSSPLRGRPALRRMLQRPLLSPADLCMPLLVVGEHTSNVVPTVTLDEVEREARDLAALGVGGVKIFAGTPARDPFGSDATDPDNAMCRAIEIIKQAAPELAVMTENCLCSYTSDKVCYVPNRNGGLDHHATLQVLAEQASQQAQAGADVIGPAGMLDGAVGVVREMLDRSGFANVAIMPHLIFTSRLYDGYRQAMNAAPRSGNRSAFQIHPSLPDQAVELALRWVDEGADMLLLEPALHTLDILVRLRDKTTAPLVPFSVSGEYTQLTHDGHLREGDYADLLMERLTLFKRCGAAMIVTYSAKHAAHLLSQPTPVIPAARRPGDAA